MAENIIAAGADNRPPMLKKSQYNSCQSRMKLYQRPHCKEKILEECDIRATNIVLQGLPPDVYILMNHHTEAKEIWDRIKLLIEVVPQQAYQAPTVPQQLQVMFPQLDSGLAVPSFLRDDSIYSLNKEMNVLGRQNLGTNLDIDITSDSNIISYEQYLNETETADAQDATYSAQQDAMIMSRVFCKTRQIYEEIVDLEKEKKALDNIIYKTGQTVQTIAMLAKPQMFYDESHNTTLGYQNPLYLTQAQRKQLVLYCGHTIVKRHDALSVIDTLETLKLAEESNLKIHAKQNDPIAKEKKVNIVPIDYAALNNASLEPLRPLDNAFDYASVNGKLVAVTPINKSRQIKNAKPRMKDSTKASRSQPLGNTKKNMISPTASSNQKNKVEDHLGSMIRLL
ncbi:hypothetical protein Tco_1321609 [Tanacetum coccineum]